MSNPVTKRAPMVEDELDDEYKIWLAEQGENKGFDSVMRWLAETDETGGGGGGGGSDNIYKRAGGRGGGDDYEREDGGFDLLHEINHINRVASDRASDRAFKLPGGQHYITETNKWLNQYVNNRHRRHKL